MAIKLTVGPAVGSTTNVGGAWNPPARRTRLDPSATSGVLISSPASSRSRYGRSNDPNTASREVRAAAVRRVRSGPVAQSGPKSRVLIFAVINMRDRGIRGAWPYAGLVRSRPRRRRASDQCACDTCKRRLDVVQGAAHKMPTTVGPGSVRRSRGEMLHGRCPRAAVSGRDPHKTLTSSEAPAASHRQGIGTYRFPSSNLATAHC